jgi:predicted nucleic acid-binding protein
MVYSDPSFLFSLFLHDANTAAAAAHLEKHPTELALTTWQRWELSNAIRLSVWRGNCAATDANQALGKIANDIADGNLVEAALVWPEVMALASKLSEKHTTTLGVRSLDLLHVAAAMSLGARKFLTCDGRQLALARAAGIPAEKI